MDHQHGHENVVMQEVYCPYRGSDQQNLAPRGGKAGRPDRSVGVKVTKSIEPRMRRKKRRLFMTHSFRVHFFHLIWSTKGRQRLITKEIQSRLYAYLGGIVRNHEGHLIEIGGMPDHVHILIQQGTLDKFSYQIRDLKCHSSLWVHQTFPHMKEFAWQEGYGSFAVSYSAVGHVREYIKNQERHHASMTFEEEYMKFLNSCEVKYDERFVFG